MQPAIVVEAAVAFVGIVAAALFTFAQIVAGRFSPSAARTVFGNRQFLAYTILMALLGGVSGLGAIFGCFVGAWFGGRIGRRPAYFGLCLLSLIFCGLLFRMIHEYGTPFLILVGIVGGVTAAFYGWLPLYLPELFPTRVRATGQGLSFNFGRILAAVGALTQGRLVSYYDGSYAKAGAVITLIYLLGLVLIWFAPETKGKPLPD